MKKYLSSIEILEWVKDISALIAVGLFVYSLFVWVSIASAATNNGWMPPEGSTTPQDWYELKVDVAPIQDIPYICEKVAGIKSYHTRGCQTWVAVEGGLPICYIIIPEVDRNVSRMLQEQIRRHEIAHCNLGNWHPIYRRPALRRRH